METAGSGEYISAHKYHLGPSILLPEPPKPSLVPLWHLEGGCLTHRVNWKPKLFVGARKGSAMCPKVQLLYNLMVMVPRIHFLSLIGLQL